MTKKILVAVLVGVFLVLPGRVWAETAQTIPTGKGSLIQLTESTGGSGSESSMSSSTASSRSSTGRSTQGRCDLVTRRIDQRINLYNATKTQREAFYQRRAAEWNNLIKRLEAAGIDATTLNNDLAMLNQKVKELSDLYQQFIDKLMAARSLPCGQSEGAFAQAVKDSSTILKQVRLKMIEIETFINTTVRNDLVALRKQLNQTTRPTVTISPMTTPNNRTQY